VVFEVLTAVTIKGDGPLVCDMAQGSVADTDFLQRVSLLISVESSQHPDTEDSSVSNTTQQAPRHPFA
jgi:hypothetical protein